MRALQTLWLLVVSLLVLACGGGSGGTADAGALPDGGDVGDAEPADASTAVDAGPVALPWSPCPFYTNGTGAEAVCATIQVPLNWDDPQGDQVELFLKRLGDPAIPGPQLWCLQGGPGGASDAYEGLAQTLLDADESLDIYLLDHRGVGRSTRLGCPVEEGAASPEGYRITSAEWPSCIASLQATWGDKLNHFTTTNAALDLGWLIDQTRAPGQPVVVHGTSYGTRWAQRYLQVFPDQPTGISLLGVVAPQFSFTRYNQQYEDQGAAYLATCAGDAFCRSKLGNDPQATYRAVLDDIGGLCPPALAAGLDRKTVRQFGAGMLLSAWHERVIPLALAYRIQRCHADDVTALELFAANVTSPLEGLLNDRLFSRALNHHVGLSELWEPPVPTMEEEQALVADALWAFGSTSKLEVAPIWPTYPQDQYAGLFATSDTAAILAMNGELDPASTLAEALTVADHYHGPSQHFVTLPGGTHSFASPTAQGYSCGLNIFFNFLQDPRAPLLDCVDDILPIDFTGTPELASVFGTADLWENGGTARAAAPPGAHGGGAVVTPDPGTLARIRAAMVRLRDQP